MYSLLNVPIKPDTSEEDVSSTTHEVETIGGMPTSRIVSPEEELVLKKFFTGVPVIEEYSMGAQKFVVEKESPVKPLIELDTNFTKGSDMFYPEEAWIQTYSGKRFTPTKPYADAIVIQDIAHSLSMQCRFSGHVKEFYSVAQHSLLVSYLCNFENALWGLLHDASEAYLVDIPSPLKRSGKFEAYIELEKEMQKAICTRFALPEEEPKSVKKADRLMLATEARDLMAPLRADWAQGVEPLPFKIVPMTQQEAKDAFMKRFYELTNNDKGYETYIKTYHKVMI